MLAIAILLFHYNIVIACHAAPIYKYSPCVPSVCTTINPSAGEAIAVRCADVILGGRNPWVVDSIVSIELAAFVLVPTSRLPNHRPKVVEELPITVVLLPRPMALAPIAIWFVSLSAFALELAPKNIEVDEIVIAVVPSAIYLPALFPIAVLLLPVVFEDITFPPIAVLFAPVVFNDKAFLPIAVFKLPLLLVKAKYPIAVF
jgi:hypothetical protein